MGIYTDAVAKHGSVSAAAKSMSVPRNTFIHRLANEKTTIPPPPPSIVTPDSILQALAQLVGGAVQKPTAAPPPTVTPEKPRIRVKAVSSPAPAPETKPQEAKKPEKPQIGGTMAHPDQRIRRLNAKRFLLTGAQNNSYPHPFLKTLENIAKRRDACLCIAQLCYNKNGYANYNITKDGVEEAIDGLWFDPSVAPYLVKDPIRIAKDFVFCAETEIPITSANPLGGYQNYTKDSSGAFAHPRVSMKSMAGTKSEGARMLYTTGVCTQRNYIQRGVGIKAEHHHTFAALYVEMDDEGLWFARQIVADEDGVCQDLNDVFFPDGRVEHRRVAAINFPDIHIEKAEAGVLDAFFEKGGVLDTLRPRVQYIHDLMDFEARNHHNIDNPNFRQRMRAEGREYVEDGFRRAADFLHRIDRPWCRTEIADSNHDEQAFQKWLVNGAGHHDEANRDFWYYWNWKQSKAIKEKDNLFRVFESAVRAYANEDGFRDVRFLGADEDSVIAGVNNGMHGHHGPNGSRGSLNGFKQLSHKVTVGHMHSAGIGESVYVVGCCALEMGYNVGASSWTVTLCVEFESGKRQLITLRLSKSGIWKWRAGENRQESQFAIAA